GAEGGRSGDVEQEQHRQFPLLHELLDVGAARARGHVPVDGPRVVALDELAHLVELDPGAAESRGVATDHHVVHQAVRADLDAPHLGQDLGVDHGTGTWSKSCWRMCSELTSSASASYVVITRWRR